MGIYMKIDGVIGDVTESGHKGWIELEETDWTMRRHVRSAVANAKNRESSSADCGEFLFKKLIDSSSHKLVSLAFTGQAQPSVKIDFTRVERGGEAIIRSIELKNAILSSLHNPAKKTETPIEIGTFNFTQIKISDFGSGIDGKTGSPKRVIYDLAQAKTL